MVWRLELVLHGGTLLRIKKDLNSRDGLQAFRGLQLSSETDFIYSRELCIVGDLSMPPGLSHEAFCLVFHLWHVLKAEQFPTEKHEELQIKGTH